MHTTGKFGPDVEEFSMPLPPNYPQHAGMQSHALKPALTLHERVLGKLRTAALPSRLEEVHVSACYVMSYLCTACALCFILLISSFIHLFIAMVLQELTIRERAGIAYHALAQTKAKQYRR